MNHIVRAFSSKDNKATLLDAVVQRYTKAKNTTKYVQGEDSFLSLIVDDLKQQGLIQYSDTITSQVKFSNTYKDRWVLTPVMNEWDNCMEICAVNTQDDDIPLLVIGEMNKEFYSILTILNELFPNRYTYKIHEYAITGLDKDTQGLNLVFQIHDTQANHKSEQSEIHVTLPIRESV